MRVMLVAAIAANTLPTTTHATGGAANGTLAGHEPPAGEVFAQLVAALSLKPANGAAPPLLPLASDPSAATLVKSAATDYKKTLAPAVADASNPLTANPPAELAAQPHHSPDILVRLLTRGAKPAVAGRPDHHAAPAIPDLNAIKNKTTLDSVTSATQTPAVPLLVDVKNLQSQLVLVPKDSLPPTTVPRPNPAADLKALPSEAALADFANPHAVGNAQAGNFAEAIAQLTDKTAAGFVANGTTVKPARGSKSDAAAATADSAKTQSQNSTASALAALSNAATRSFTDQQSSSSHALPVHELGGQKGGNGSANSDSKSRQDNAHAQNTPVPAANDARTAAVSAAPTPESAAPTAPQHPAPVNAAPPADGGSIAATNGATQNASPVQGTPAQIPVTLQVAPQHAILDANALAVSIATRSQAGSRHFDIRLNPAELGRVDVRLTVDDAGKAQASLTVEKPQTLELLQKDSSHLERALKDAGLDLSQNGLNFSLRGQQQQGGNSPSSRGRALNVQAIAAVEAAPSTTLLSSLGASHTRLDIRV